MPGPSNVDAFIRRWEKASGSERANYQLFLTELCKLLDLPQPDPARDDTRDNAYVFERRVVFQHGDGSESSGFIDLYHRGNFVLEAKKVRKNEGKAINDSALLAVLRDLHDHLDRAVFDAYGWSDLADVLVGKPGATTPVQDKTDGQIRAEEELLSRLVALNRIRVAEEKREIIHLLRPEFQALQAATSKPEQREIEMPENEEIAGKAAKTGRQSWPKELPDQVRAVAEVLAGERRVLDADDVAKHFSGKGPWKKRLPQLLETLESVGRARKVKGGWVAAV